MRGNIELRETMSLDIPAIPKPASDSQVIADFKNGDRPAFNLLVRKYEDRVYRHCLRIINDEEESFDIAQEVFMKVYRSLDSYIDNCYFPSWLYRITLNCCLDYLRQKRRRAAEIPLFQKNIKENGDTIWEDHIPDDTYNPEQRLMRLELNHAIINAIARLPKIFRMTLVMREIEGLKYREIAELLQCSQARVKSRIYRARLLLKEWLAPHREELTA